METWHTESRRLTTLDYRLFDIQHAVLPTRLPLRRFYEEPVRTQGVLNRKHLSVASLSGTLGTALRLLLRGQTNFIRGVSKFNRVYNPDRQHADHSKPVVYAMRPPQGVTGPPSPSQLYVHVPLRRGTTAGASSR